jgi:hypothetical protein
MPADSFNNAVFDQIRKNRIRGVVGFQARFGWFLVVGSFGFDITKPEVRQASEDHIDRTYAGPPAMGGTGLVVRDLPAQFSANFSVGAAF